MITFHCLYSLHQNFCLEAVSTSKGHLRVIFFPKKILKNPLKLLKYVFFLKLNFLKKRTSSKFNNFISMCIHFYPLLTLFRNETGLLYSF